MSQENQEGKANVPSHHGRFPFPPEEKRPALLTPEMRMPRLYGKGQNLIATYTCASTDKIHVSTFTVLPGKWFDPPDIHVGDEVYYVLRGAAQAFNPETGEVTQLQEGDFVYIPAETWHQIWNFGDLEVVFINWIAPQLWSKDKRGTSIHFDKTPVFYKDGVEGEKR
jgi:mannose-6-phosphate isomerase-like protein (cupin superfamily)